MDTSSKNQHALVERYVTGLMDENEIAEFEVFILSQPDWQKMIQQARFEFDEIHADEWAQDVESTLKQQTVQASTGSKVAEKMGFSWRFTFLPTALAFGLGALMAWTFKTEPWQIKQLHQVNLQTKRSVTGSDEQIKDIFIAKDVDSLEFKLSVEDILQDHYSVVVRSRSAFTVRHRLEPDDYGDLTINLVGSFNYNELITLRVMTKPGGDVIREYRVLIKEK